MRRGARPSPGAAVPWSVVLALAVAAVIAIAGWLGLRQTFGPELPTGGADVERR